MDTKARLRYKFAYQLQQHDLQQLGHGSNLDVHQQMNKVVVHIYQSGILLSHKKNAIESVLVRWTNLEPVIHSEESQKEKNKFRILTHIYGI